MYNGKCEVSLNRLENFLKIARELEIVGLVEEEISGKECELEEETEHSSVLNMKRESVNSTIHDEINENEVYVNGESTTANEVKVDNNPDEPLSNEHNEIAIQTSDEVNEKKPDCKIFYMVVNYPLEKEKHIKSCPQINGWS